MNKIAPLLTVLVLLFLNSVVVNADCDIAVFEGEDLVIYGQPKEIERYQEVFESPVSSEEISPEIARQLLSGEIEEYEIKKGEEYLENFPWRFPSQYKINRLKLKFELNVDGKISRIQSSVPETEAMNLFADLVFRIFPLLIIVGVIIYVAFLDKSTPYAIYGIFFLASISNIILYFLPGWKRYIAIEMPLITLSAIAISFVIRCFFIKRFPLKEETAS